MRGRVGGLISHVGQKIWEATMLTNYDKLASMGDVFRGMVALLTGPGLDDVDDLKDYFNKTVDSLVRSRRSDMVGGATYAIYADSMPILHDFYWRMQANPYAMDKVQGGSCPGDRGLGFEMGLFDKNDIVLTSNHVMMDVLGGDVRESGEESYSFDHEGKCVVCKVDPKMLGPCGICKDCDGKLRQQAD